MSSRAWAGVPASSSASMTRLSLGPASSAATRSSSRSGRGTPAARAISAATSSTVLPLACTAQPTEPGVARTAVSESGNPARRAGSAVVTILPRTADFPTPGEPVTTSAL